MNSSPQPPARTAHYAGRADVRRAVHEIVRQFLLQHLAQLRANGSDAAARLTGAQRRHVLGQSYVFEDVLYKQAGSLEEYLELSTLEERVFGVVRALQRREAEMAGRGQQAANDGRSA